MPDRTHEQDVVDAQVRISDLKADYCTALNKYLEGKATSEKRLPLLLSCQQAGTAYFNFVENFVGNSDLLGAHQNANWAQGFAEDCAETLRSLPAHFTFLTEEFVKIGISPIAGNFLPGPTAYANMQRMIKAYLTNDICRELEDTFISANLPIYGFQNETKVVMSKNPPKPFDHTEHLKTAAPILIIGMIISAILGLACVSTGAYALYLKSMSQTEIKLFGATLSTGATGVALVFIGAVVLATVIIKAIARTKPPKGV